MLYDPLSSGFGDDDTTTPPWPTTPHTPNSPIPNLRRASSPLPRAPDKSDSVLYDKHPQIYGQPEPGLISPRTNVGFNGVKYEKPEPYLNVRITGLDRNRRDILVRFDAQTNLSNFTGTTYRNVSRSYLEFQQFYDTIIHNNPQTIVPALPLAQTSAPSDDEDDRLVRIMLQRWITRVCVDPILLHDEEVRSFVESDFGYQPTPRPRRKTSSGFGIMRRSVPDDDEELQRARFELTKLEGLFFDAAKALDKVSLTRKGLASAHAEMGNKLINVATTEAHPPIANAFRKIGRTWHSLSDLDQAQAISECVILSDSLGYQGLNARSAKETLQQRTSVLEEYQAAVKSAISKRRQIERLKASSNIRPEKVDGALEEMEEANKYEQILARRAEGISQNLHRALQTHNRLVTEDITAALIEHSRTSLMYERQLLRELESLRPDISNASSAFVPVKPNGIPRPIIVPPLEDFSKPPPPCVESNPSTRYSTPIPPALPNSGMASPVASGRTGVPQNPLPPQSPGAGSSKFSQTPSQSSFISSVQSPGLPPAPAPVRSEGPPLGGRFVDGTRSMFVKPVTSSPLTTTPGRPSVSGLPPSSANSLANDPLATSSPSPLRDPILRPVSSNSLPVNGDSVDPLGGVKAPYMSASVRVQPTRPRLDAREAASKLANMF